MVTLATIAEEFGNKLKPHDRRSFDSCKLQDLQKEIATIQSQREKTNTMMNMTRLERFLAATEQLRHMFVVTKTAGRDRAMALLWGSIRYVLKVTDPHEKAFDGVLDIYEQFGIHVPQLAQYEHMFSESSPFEECLVNIYRDVQRFHQVSYELFSLRLKLWHQLHKSVWKDLKSTFKELFSSLDSHRGFIQSHAGRLADAFNSSASSATTMSMDSPSGSSVCNNESWAQYRIYTRTQWEEFEDKEFDRRHAQRLDIQRRIPSSTKISDMHQDFLKTKCPNTGRWLFRSYGAVTDWMMEDEIPNSIIWLQGNRGFGKTILASSIVQELERRREKGKSLQRPPSDSKVYYFYCHEDDDQNCTHLGVLKGILAQMANQIDYILPLCDERLSREGIENLSNIEVAQGLLEVFIEYGPRQYIVIDGLDECKGSEARQIADFFMGQADKCDNQMSPGQLRILFMSRPMPELKSHLPEDDANIILDPKDNAGDIREYVRYRIGQFSESGASAGGFNLTEWDKANIEDTVCHQSEDMFLFAHLAMEYLLQQTTKGDLLEKSRHELMPGKLPHMYEKLIGTLESNLETAQWEKAKLLLGWLVCAKRPLQWRELQSILSFDIQKKKVDFDNRMLRLDVRKLLGSIVHILEGGHVRLIHRTARRYIVNNNHINETEVQYKLTTLCLSYLSLPCFTEEYESEDRKEDARLGYFSFQDYACSYWHRHIESFIRDCSYPVEISGDQKVQIDFATSLSDFIVVHQASLATDMHDELAPDFIAKYNSTPIYHPMLTLWNHIFTHQKGSIELRNNVGIEQIDKALQKNRDAIETNFSPDDPACIDDTIKDYYGPNLFKCKQTLCYFFHVGYDSKKMREDHENRHSRPYACPVGCNMAPIGFSKRKDRDRHVRQYHPEESNQPSRFEDPYRRQDTGSFVCNICKKTFTRRENLKGHERSHFGTRPYQCYQCGKAFARISDCKRHEKNKSCKMGGRKARTGD